MATDKSTKLTSALAGTLVSVPSNVKIVVDTIEVSDNANNDLAVLNIKIPTHALITSVKVASDDLGTAGTATIGLFKVSLNGTISAVDDDCIATGIDMATAATSLTEYRFNVKNIDTINKKAWEIAGESAEPTEYSNYLLGLKFSTGTTAAGTVTAIVTYIE